MAQLFAFREDRLGFRFDLKPSSVLGRAPECDLILFDRSASRRHAGIVNVDDHYFVVDLESTNGTMVNGAQIDAKSKLEPFDAIKIGQEVFIYEPGIDVLVGPAQSAIVIDDLHEDVAGLVAMPVETAAAQITAEQGAALMKLAHSLNTRRDDSQITDIICKFASNCWGSTFISILWPNRSLHKRLNSICSYPDDKRLIINRLPFNRATEAGEALLWPRNIAGLHFQDGNRVVEHGQTPILAGPLFAGERKGLFCIENHNRRLNESDLKMFAAFLQVVSPALNTHLASREYDMHMQLKRDQVEDPVANMAARDEQTKIVFATAARVAETTSMVLLTGEAGTGKAALARYIHDQSNRRNGRFISATVSTMDSSQIERFLFGQYSNEDGDEQITHGLLEMADGGTLFLRHVEHLTPSAQKALLAALEEGLFYPLGAQRSRAVDVRIISATSGDLLALVEAGHFREDLYVRLNQVSISIPPLRGTRTDIVYLAGLFLNQHSKMLGLEFSGIDTAVIECLRAYPWPGNIAELKAECELLALFSRNGRIALDNLPLHLRMAPEAYLTPLGDPPATLVGETERHILALSLARCQGDVEQVAALLSKTPEDVILKMRASGLDPVDYQPIMHSRLPKGPGQTSVPQDF